VHFSFRPLVGLSAWLALAGATGATPATTIVPRWESEFSTTFIGSTRLEGSGPAQSAGRSQAFVLSLLGRQALPAKDFYLAGGVQAESFHFSGSSIAPRRLEDFAAILGAEYRRDGEVAAELMLRPGWYFENQPNARAWDVPFDLITGVPLVKPVDGVIGVTNARFYHHALPIFGLVANLGPHTRLQLVYPEPALIFSPRADRSWRIRGELTGTGFRRDGPASRSVVEYASYQVGAEFRRAWPDGRELTVAAGVEAVRSFDFFRERQRWHGGGAPFVKLGLRLPSHSAADPPRTPAAGP
jgi:hypothetical protein